jgi:hypothetical protein
MQELILFCQASADVQYVLAIYNKYCSNYKISIFVVSIEGIYKFLCSLNLKTNNLVFIPYLKNFSYKNPFKIIKERQRIKNVYPKYFKHTENSVIYFFSHFFDWTTFSILAKLSKNNTINFVDHYDTKAIQGSRNYNINIKEYFQIMILKYITKIKFKILKVNRRKFLEFPYYKYGIKKVDPPKVSKQLYEKFSFKINNVDNRSILLFVSDHSKMNIIKNFNESIEKIVQLIKEKGFNIFLKPHPSYLYPKFLEKYAKVLPDYIPAEFLDVHDFSAIVGIESTAMVNFAKTNKIQVYSLLDLFSFTNEEDKDRIKNYLNSLSDNKIYFVNSLKDFSQCLQSLN